MLFSIGKAMFIQVEIVWSIKQEAVMLSCRSPQLRAVHEASARAPKRTFSPTSVDSCLLSIPA